MSFICYSIFIELSIYAYHAHGPPSEKLMLQTTNMLTFLKEAKV